MTTGIRTLIKEYLAKEGRTGKAKLCIAVEKSENTLNRWLKDGIPNAQDAFNLALACGCERDEALRLAREEALPESAREPA